MIKHLLNVNILKKTSFQVLLIIFLAFPTFVSLIRPGFFPMQDDLQAFRVLEMGKCFSDFQIPCQWIPDMGYQYGYPQFLFYSPSIYYFGALMHLFGFQIIDVVKILFGLGFILGAVSMYGFLRSWLGPKPGLLGAILYTYLPFKAAQVYVRGSLSEFWAAVFFPLLFWFSMDLIRKRKRKYGIFFALAVGGLLLTHNLMSFIFFPLLAVWILVWLYLEKGLELKRIFLFGLVGIGLAAFFVLPLILERQFVHTESLLGGYFDYRQHFVNLNQLFISNYWGYGSSVLGDNDEVTLSVGIVQWILGGLGFLSVLIFLRKEKKLVVITTVLFILELGILFMMHQKSSFIWSLIPALAWLQFPWRFLAVSGFLLAILGSIGIYVFDTQWNKKWTFGVVGGLLLVLLILHGRFFQPKEWFMLSDAEKFSGQNWEKQLTISIFDYLPKSAVLPPNKKAPDLPEVLDGNAYFTRYDKQSNTQAGDITVTSQTATIRFPMYDFPGMKLIVDGVEQAFWHTDCRGEDYCFGLITSQIPQGSHIVAVGLHTTIDRFVGNMITIFSIILVVLIALRKEKLKNEKN